MATWIVHFVQGSVKIPNNPMKWVDNGQPEDYGFVVDLAQGEKDVYPWHVIMKAELRA